MYKDRVNSTVQWVPAQCQAYSECPKSFHLTCIPPNERGIVLPLFRIMTPESLTLKEEDGNQKRRLSRYNSWGEWTVWGSGKSGRKYFKEKDMTTRSNVIAKLSKIWIKTWIWQCRGHCWPYNCFIRNVDYKTSLEWSREEKQTEKLKKTDNKTSLSELCYKGGQWVEGNNSSRKSLMFV